MQVEIARVQALLSKKHPNPDKAIKMLRPLLKRGNCPWMVYHYMGVALLQKGDHSKALEYLLRAVDAGGAERESFHLVSVAFYNLQNFEQAIQYGYQAIAKNPDFLEAWINIGAAHRAMANLDEAMKAYTQANRIDPKNAGIAYRIGSIYFDQGDFKKARELYKISAQMEPEYIEAHLGQALIDLKLQKYTDAEAKIKKTLEIAPNNRLCRIQLAVVYKEWGHYSEAIRINEQLLRENPKDGRLRVNYALCLLEVGRFNEAEHNYMKALKDSPDAHESLSNYLMGIHYNPERTKEEIFDAHALWDAHFAPKIRNERPVPQNLDPNKKLRVGFISGGFRKHPVGWMITRALENLPTDLFEVYGYNTHSVHDEFTMRIRNRCEKWTTVIGYNDEIVAKIIRDDEVDILVELSGHSAFNRLKTVALEPVPITVKWVGGLFNTTGLESMDYLLTDNYESPKGEEPFYTEKLVRMPDDYVCYEPPAYDIKVAELPASYNGFVTFGCFNNPSKLNDQLIAQWSQILHAVEGSKLFLKSKQYDTADFVQQVVDLFAKNGIEKNRLLFEGYAMHEDLLASYNQVDIALDPWPYSGGLTTCEALWMGVPVVTCAGPTFAGRHSVTHLSNTGNSDWVTENWQDYKAKVVELASDLEKLAQTRAGLRNQLLNSPLCDGARFGAHLSNAFRAMWKQRVNGYENNLGEGEWQDHIDVKALSEEELETFCNAHDLSMEPPVLQKYELIEWEDGIKLAVPSSKENFTHYALVERKDRNKTMRELLSEMIHPGDRVLEVGAGYGELSMHLAKWVGKTGQVITLEPNKEIFPYLSESKRLNRFEQLETLPLAADQEEDSSYLKVGSVEEFGVIDKDNGTQPVQTSTVDAVVDQHFEEFPQILVVDVNGDLSQILNGAQSWITADSPLICLGNQGAFDDDQVQFLRANGYSIYEFIEKVGVLSAVEPEHQSTARWLFALSPQWLNRFAEKGFIFTGAETQIELTSNYVQEVQEQPWASAFVLNWIGDGESEAEKNYFHALNQLWEVEHNSLLTNAQKASLSVEAAISLLDLYTANPGILPVACSLSRAFLNIGKQKDAASILKSTFERAMTSNQPLDVSLPFMLPLVEQEEQVITGNAIDWLKIKIAEAWLLLQHSSTYFLDQREVKVLKQINGNPHALPIIKTIAEQLLIKGEVQIVPASNRSADGKFIHICFNHTYAKGLNDMLMKVAEESSQEHYLLLERHTAIDNFFVDVSDNPNAEVFNHKHDLDRIKKLCTAADVDGIIFHGIFQDWQKKLVKHIGFKKQISWVLWGGDLYNPLKFGRPMRFIAGFVDSILTPIDGDVEVFTSKYGRREVFEFGYPYAGLYGEITLNTEKSNPPLIIVGNSGDKGNEHLAVLKVLSEKSDIHNYRIVLPVAYSLSEEYESQLIDGIQKLGLSDITSLQKDFLPAEEYVQMLASSAMFIGAHNRQQAMGNILGSMYGGGTTVLRKQIMVNDQVITNPSWDFLTHNEFKVTDYQILKSVKALSELEKLSIEQVKKHQEIIVTEFSLEKRADQLISACEQILEQTRERQTAIFINA
ncbi:MAG: TDP-N-acetylfucosamine:lipid II N-acetylfucosaminyltransferase [Balneolaceae bacterium]|nr:TDP-N-acetylfucosamine:lipid II N-acetylfucosaminyltransferase [Balneolaceae bacterium]